MFQTYIKSNHTSKFFPLFTFQQTNIPNLSQSFHKKIPSPNRYRISFLTSNVPSVQFGLVCLHEKFEPSPMASSLEVTRVVSPCGAVPNERKRRTAVERGKKSVVFRSERGWGMMKGVKLGLFDNLKTREFVQKI